MLQRFKNAWHNIVLHPIAGVLWLLGLERAGDLVHGEGPVPLADLRQCPLCQQWHDKEYEEAQKLMTTDTATYNKDGSLASLSSTYPPKKE